VEILTGDLRETMIAAYDAYNRATAQLRQLVDSVGSSRRSPASPSRPTCSRSSA